MADLVTGFTMKRMASILALMALGGLGLLWGAPDTGARLAKAERRPETNGWIFVHLEGSPATIGFQHGYLLAPEIREAHKRVRLSMTHESGKSYGFIRKAAEEVFWPRVEREYREEMQGIAEGLKARRVNLDLWDVVAMNAMMEISGYYLPWLDRNKGHGTAPDRCSAFVATGSYTTDGRPVIAHNNWSGYLDGSFWNIIFDIVPARGHRILMDGYPGLIHSGDDFGMNSAGLMITETTITQFHGFDPKGIPEFARARKAMQYASSIDDFALIMREGNNGGYANNWLIADRNTNEIASLELGLKNVNLWRKKDGYFAGANFPVDPKLTREETTFSDDPAKSPTARRLRWERLMAGHKGRIDVEAGKRFLADHYDTFTLKIDPNERTLCGHIDLSPRGSKPWQEPYGAAGVVQAKIADDRMAARMSFAAAMGHPCGIPFKAAEFLRRHPAYKWQRGLLRDLNSGAWTEFQARQ
jgi:hypothetical protein